jgi:lipopolysaccharide/colanic/teichoic acid biosynthesis glycosyltransferase
MYTQVLKPMGDFCFAAVVLLLLSPVLVFIAVFLTVSNQGSPFFIQKRPGKNQRIFKIIKFKTMNDVCDASGKLLPDAKRLTLVGKFVRKFSLDEIPQFLNVLKGDMSLIGPRPLLPDYLHLYSDFQNKRHEVKPGITGWAQVNGRNAISWDQKFEFDVWYVTNISFSLDLRIFFRTIGKVLKSEGINAADAATIEPFNGNN